jgi:microsomal epoxide hydrolase
MSTWPPKSYLDRMFNIKQLTKMSKGGHFAAMEQPDLLVEDVVKFAKIIR